MRWDWKSTRGSLWAVELSPGQMSNGNGWLRKGKRHRKAHCVSLGSGWLADANPFRWWQPECSAVRSHWPPACERDCPVIGQSSALGGFMGPGVCGVCCLWRNKKARWAHSNISTARLASTQTLVPFFLPFLYSHLSIAANSSFSFALSIQREPRIKLLGPVVETFEGRRPLWASSLEASPSRRREDLGIECCRVDLIGTTVREARRQAVGRRDGRRRKPNAHAHHAAGFGCTPSSLGSPVP
jgi:hypothetical protein